jgi:radical SAM superfamily enzyme YgiQ (UPF0313 family)
MRNHFLLAAVNAKYIHTCLGAYDLAAFASAHGQELEIEEFTINEKEEEILGRIAEKAPDGIFFSCYIWNISLIERMLPKIHERLPKASIYLGGPEVSFDPEERLEKFPFLSGVIAGEGEAVMTKLLAGWPAREAMGRILRADALLPLDMVPFPYEEAFLREAGKRGKILYYETSRGCPFSCSYCLSSRKEPVRLRSMDLVLRELRLFLDAKVPQVKFTDRTFNCSHEHAYSIWEFIHENDNGTTNFHFEIGADLLRKEDLELLSKMRRGLIQFEIGVQSTNAETLASVSRTVDMEHLRQAVLKIHEAGRIHQHLDLIAGLPYEDYASFGRSFNDVWEMKPDQLQLGFLKVLKGTEMERLSGKFGIVYDSAAPYEVIRTPWLSEAERERLERIARITDIYHNSAQYTQTLPYLLSRAENPFAFFEALALCYEKNGCPSVTDSRITRYEILRDFALGPMFPGTGSGEPVRREELIERLSVDLYLREKLKHRPDWVQDLSGRYEFDYGRRDVFTNNAEVRKK